MKSIILIIAFMFSSMNMWAQKEKIPIEENPKKVIGTENVLLVPKYCKEKYEAAPEWNNFNNIVETKYP